MVTLTFLEVHVESNKGFLLDGDEGVNEQWK